MELARKRHPGLAQILDKDQESQQRALKEAEAAAKAKQKTRSNEGRKSLNEAAPLNSVLELVFVGIHLIYEVCYDRSFTVSHLFC
jgi:hypothetical protein